jgi:hypothetical protein
MIFQEVFREFVLEEASLLTLSGSYITSRPGK